MLNNRGTATFEMIPILVIIVLLLSFSFGFFGVVHSGILNSIAARNYAFETFRHRSNLTYFKDTAATDEALRTNYYDYHSRHHGIGSDKGTDSRYVSSKRPLDKFGSFSVDPQDDPSTHNNEVPGLKESRRNSKVGVANVWLKTVYGICLNVQCAE